MQRAEDFYLPPSVKKMENCIHFNAFISTCIFLKDIKCNIKKNKKLSIDKLHWNTKWAIFANLRQFYMQSCPSAGIEHNFFAHLQNVSRILYKNKRKYWLKERYRINRFSDTVDKIWSNIDIWYVYNVSWMIISPLSRKIVECNISYS